MNKITKKFKTLNQSGIFRAFTLAEILITLSIIGVIASMTIPSLVQDVQDAQLKTAWKKTFADMNQATQRLIQANAGSLKGVFSSTNNMRDKYLEYLNYTRKCDSGESAGNCWHTGSNWKYLKGTPTNDSWTGFSKAILNNGSLVTFVYYADCNQAAGSTFNCGVLMVDINGYKGPNTIGKDIFWINVHKNKITPYGAQGVNGDVTTDCVEGSTASSNSGNSCSAKYLYQ